ALVPVHPEGVDEGLHAREEALVDAEGLTRRRRGIEAHEATVHERLDPRVGVPLLDRVVAAVRVEAPADEARHVSGGDAERAEHEHHRGGEILAVPGLPLEEEVLDGVDALDAHLLERVRVDVAPEVTLDRPRHLEGPPLVADHLPGELRHAAHLGRKGEVSIEIRAVAQARLFVDHDGVAPDARAGRGGAHVDAWPELDLVDERAGAALRPLDAYGALGNEQHGVRRELAEDGVPAGVAAPALGSDPKRRPREPAALWR